MVRSTSLSALAGLHFFQVIQSILNRLTSINLTDAGFVRRLTALRTVFQQYDAAVRRLRSSPNTAPLLDLDELRDRLFRALRQVLDAYTDSPVPAKSGAADVLLRYQDNYGRNVPNMAQIEETAAIANILQDFAKPDAVAALAQLPMLTADWITPLRTANQQFAARYETRTDDLHVEIDGLTARYRSETQAAFNALGNRLNALLEIDADSATPNANLTLAATGINADVETAKANYRRGGTRSSDGTPTPP